MVGKEEGGLVGVGFWVWRWKVLRVELELRVELRVYNSKMPLRPDGPWGCRLRFWVWRWEVLREELELWGELVVYHSEMPYGRALLSAYRAVCHYSGIISGFFLFRAIVIVSICGLYDSL